MKTVKVVRETFRPYVRRRIAAIEEAMKSVKRRRSWRPSERAATLAELQRDLEMLQSIADADVIELQSMYATAPQMEQR